MKIEKNLEQNINYLENIFEDCGDIVKRKFPIGVDKNIWLYITYIDVMTDRDVIDESVMNSLMIKIKQVPPTQEKLQESIYDALKYGGITTADFKEVSDMSKCIDEILGGNTLLMIDGFEKALIISTKGFPKRSVSTADTEVVLQGSKEAFTETFRVNTVLVRRRLKDPNLKLKQMTVGVRSKTDIGLMYIKDIVRNELLTEVEERISRIDIDAILDSSYIEQFIEDDWISPFPQMQMTERPDKVASALLEGRIAIIVDNSPFAILVPTVLTSFYQSSEDYYQRWEIMSFIRVLRYIAGFLAICLPGLYLAITVYHPDMIPMELLFKMSEARQTIPIPAVVEVLLLELAFETLREAGIRLPASIGSTLGIVGGIIIGQSAVEAGIVSPLVVIIISLTGICSFAIPTTSLVSGYRIVKYFVIIMSAFLGLFGFWIALILCLIHLCSLNSFGIPYLYPFVSTQFNDLKDTVIKLPIFTLKKRPIFAKNSQKTRLRDNRNKKI